VPVAVGHRCELRQWSGRGRDRRWMAAYLPECRFGPSNAARTVGRYSAVWMRLFGHGAYSDGRRVPLTCGRDVEEASDRLRGNVRCQRVRPGLRSQWRWSCARVSRLARRHVVGCLSDAGTCDHRRYGANDHASASASATAEDDYDNAETATATSPDVQRRAFWRVLQPALGVRAHERWHLDAVQAVGDRYAVPVEGGVVVRLGWPVSGLS
jgi:hypothetical protein